MTLRPLTREEIESPAFWMLLHEAAGVDAGALRRIRDTELPELDVIGVVADEVVAFAASAATPQRIVLEYIAVDARHRGEGLGTRLVDAVRGARPGIPLVAETDDDAVDFYRALGFTVDAAPRDPRWPDRQRYRCTHPAG
ncbi:GNAT family N-acetyltransferase [Microbacterium sp. No. 7]|uniref:GNAT family N-acetyltransferase n=1 Tax=Microbacterium sp. No. 7 TaxID=1714373 RepID=UPI0006CF82A2|nr:GNAT family N-acetyltransferase [Microbacterium sp. No. 7]ALJ21475.1 hypothetical protein AOA12_16890 [Microbacterium sp. No. 7]